MGALFTLGALAGCQLFVSVAPPSQGNRDAGAEEAGPSGAFDAASEAAGPVVADGSPDAPVVSDARPDVKPDVCTPCTVAISCDLATCCTAGDTTPPAPSGARAVNVRWGLAGLSDALEMRVAMTHAPTTAIGMELVLFDGTVGSRLATVSFETAHWVEGRNIGPGVRFKRAGPSTVDDARAVSPSEKRRTSEYIELYHPHDFGGQGEFNLTLTRGETDAGGDWFELVLTPESTLLRTPIGAIRFDRASPTFVAAIGTVASSSFGLLQGVASYGDIPQWSASLRLLTSTLRAQSAVLEYPLQGGREVPNSNGWYDSQLDRVHFAAGGSVARCSPPGPLF